MFISCFQREIPKNNIFQEYKYIVETGNINNTKINSNINSDINTVMKNHKIPYAFIIAADCKTGEIIAINEYSERIYPKGKYINTPILASSIFKLIPLAAVIGKGIYKPNNTIKYYGNLYSDLKNYFKIRNNKKYKHTISLTNAIAKSCNPAFAEIGLSLDKKTIIEYSKKFLFTKGKIRGMNLGYIDSLEENKDKAFLCSGLKYSNLTGFHALMIAIAIGNEGVLEIPKININDKKEQKRIISKTTANYMLQAMKNTTLTGTSAKIFKIDKNIAKKTFAKTGSLYGKNPNGFYNWFVGIYEGKNTNYAIVAFVVNDATWDVKASYLGFKTIQFIRKYVEN